MGIKLKWRTQFPALVSALSPLTLVKTGLSYVFGLDITALRTSLDPIYLSGSLTPPVNITPPVTSNTQGIVVTQSTPNTGSVVGPINLNYIKVTDNGQTVTGGVDSFGEIANQTSAFRVDTRVNGGSANHFGVNSMMDVTATTGGVSSVVGGIRFNSGSTITGTGWSIIGFANVGPTTNLNQSAIGIESEMLVATGGAVKDRIAFSANSQGPVAATGIDAAFMVNLAAFNSAPYNGAAPFKDGLYFNNTLYGANAFPIATTGNILRGDTGTVANFANFSGLTVTGNILNFPNFVVSGSGSAVFGGGSGSLVANKVTSFLPMIINSVNAGAIQIGPNGATNPAFQVDTSFASAANGIYVYGTAAGSGANITTNSSATNEGLFINAKGTGAVTIGNVSSGGVTIKGTPSTASAAAGYIGEYIESVVASGSAVALTTATPKTVTSISLTAGDWDVDVIGYALPAATTSMTGNAVSVSGTTNTIDGTSGKVNGLSYAAVVPGGSAQSMVIPPYRLSLSATTTVFLIVYATFTVSTCGAYGLIRARRVF